MCWKILPKKISTMKDFWKRSLLPFFLSSWSYESVIVVFHGNHEHFLCECVSFISLSILLVKSIFLTVKMFTIRIPGVCWFWCVLIIIHAICIFCVLVFLLFPTFFPCLFYDMNQQLMSSLNIYISFFF